MGLDALLARLAGERDAVTAVTPVAAADVTAKPAPLLACTAVTAVTPLAGVTASESRADRWLLHFVEREPLTITFAPAVMRADALARYPDAVAAQPVSEPAPAPLPVEVAGRIDECITADLYGDQDRELLVRMYAADADATRALIDALHTRIGRCYGCQHFARPGLSDGHCGGRADLAPAYGPGHPLRLLPADRWARCDHFLETP
jgi:hypothetical protein